MALVRFPTIKIIFKVLEVKLSCLIKKYSAKHIEIIGFDLTKKAKLKRHIAT